MYKVAFYSGLVDFERQVNEAIAEGFEPVGGVCIVFVGYNTYYYQALYKKEK